MKKYVSLFLALIMIFTLASCGGKTEENTTVSPVSYTHLDVYKRQLQMR